MISPFAPQSPWTDERTEQLKLLWEKGLSATQIAAELSIGDITRNAVIGKVHRLGLMGRATVPAKSRKHVMEPQKPSRKPKEKPGVKPWSWLKEIKKLTQPQPLPGPEASPDLTHAVSIFDHKVGQCRWIICDAVPNIHALRYCGAKVACGEASYCEQHLWQSMYRNRRAA